MPRKTASVIEPVVPKCSSVSIERLFLWPLVLVLSAALAWSYGQYYQANRELAIYKDPVRRQELDQANEERLLAEIKTKIDLPAGEPAVSVIVDAEALQRDQPFFRDCQNGDRLVLYQDFAVLYRPDTKQVVNSGTIKPAADAAQASADAPITVEVRNGSAKKGQASDLSERLKEQGWLVLGIDNAATTSYQGNLIVAKPTIDLGSLVTDLQAQTTSSLPAGEVSSSADLIIILGN